MVRYDPAPAPIRVEAGWELSCPWQGRVDLDRCRRCPFLQGTLEGADLEVLCGFAHGAPLRLPGRWPGNASGGIDR